MRLMIEAVPCPLSVSHTRRPDPTVYTTGTVCEHRMCGMKGLVCKT